MSTPAERLTAIHDALSVSDDVETEDVVALIYALRAAAVNLADRVKELDRLRVVEAAARTYVLEYSGNPTPKSVLRCFRGLLAALDMEEAA